MEKLYKINVGLIREDGISYDYDSEASYIVYDEERGIVLYDKAITFIQKDVTIYATGSTELCFTNNKNVILVTPCEIECTPDHDDLEIAKKMQTEF